MAGILGSKTLFLLLRRSRLSEGDKHAKSDLEMR